MEALAISVFLAILVEMNGDPRNVANVVREEDSILTANDASLDLLEPLHKVGV